MTLMKLSEYEKIKGEIFDKSVYAIHLADVKEV